MTIIRYKIQTNTIIIPRHSGGLGLVACTLEMAETGQNSERDRDWTGSSTRPGILWSMGENKDSISLTDLGLLWTERKFPWSAKLDSQLLGMESPFCKRERGEMESGGSLDLTSVMCLHSAETGASRAWPSW